MAVIKSSDTPTSVRPFSMSDIEAYARTMLLRARQQADQLLAAAQTEAEAMKQRGHAEGLATGKREGVAQGLVEGTEKGRKQAFDAETQKLTEALTAMQTLTHSFEQARCELVARAEAEVLPLALAIAQKVTRRTGQIDSAVVQMNVAEAIKLIAAKHDVRLTINPTQRKIAEETVTRLQQQWPQLEHVRFEDDEAVAPGGCRVSTAGGEIDADLDAQLNRIAMELVPDTQSSG